MIKFNLFLYSHSVLDSTRRVFSSYNIHHEIAKMLSEKNKKYFGTIVLSFIFKNISVITLRDGPDANDHVSLILN